MKTQSSPQSPSPSTPTARPGKAREASLDLNPETGTLRVAALSKLQWWEANSSAVARVAYWPETGQLYVQMHSTAEVGVLYVYEIDGDTFLALVSAPSVGQFFVRHIRNLPFRKLRLSVA